MQSGEQADEVIFCQVVLSTQGCQFGFFDAKLDKFGFFSRPLASKILFGFLAFFPSEFGFFFEAFGIKNFVWLFGFFSF